MAEQHAQSARGLQSSAFTRKRLTETKSRSARNATQSFPSKMTPFWKKKSEKVRIQQPVPSFFTSIGTEYIVREPKEARKVLEENKPCICLFVPERGVFADSYAWANALSSASYLIILANKDGKDEKAFMKRIDSIIFSPVPRRLSAAFIASNDEEAEKLAKAAEETFHRIVTIRYNPN